MGKIFREISMKLNKNAAMQICHKNAFKTLNFTSALMARIIVVKDLISLSSGRASDNKVIRSDRSCNKVQLKIKVFN